jgi:NADH-quinone oxidoreductase subunit J
MSGGLIFFLALALIAVAAALGMLFSRNAIYSALFLVLNFSTAAVIYLTLSAPFIALVQITVYAGAIMILFLFVIMLLGAEQLKGEETLPWQRPLAILLGIVLLVLSIYGIVVRPGLNVPMPVPGPTFGVPFEIGMELFQHYLLPFEVTSFILLIAVVGAIVLTRVGRIPARRPSDRRPISEVQSAPVEPHAQ